MGIKLVLDGAVAAELAREEWSENKGHRDKDTEARASTR